MPPRAGAVLKYLKKSLVPGKALEWVALGGGRMHNGVKAVALFKEKLRGGTPEGVFSAIAECHSQAGARYIVGAGCEIPRDTPPENVRALAEYAHSHEPAQPVKGDPCPKPSGPPPDSDPQRAAAMVCNPSSARQ